MYLCTFENKFIFICSKMLKIHKPLDGEPYSVEKSRTFLEAQSKLAEEIALKNAELEELREAFGQSQL